MSEIARWGPGRPARSAREVLQEAHLTALRVDAIAYVARQTQERVVDLDNHRRSLAGSDEVLNGLLAEVEVAFLRKAMGLTSSMFTGFGR